MDALTIAILLAEEIAKAAAAQATKSLIEKFLGTAGNPEQILRSAIQEITQQIHQQLEESVIESANTTLKSLQTMFIHYHNAPSQFKLDQLTIETQKLVDIFERFGLRTSGPWIVSAMLQLAVLQERSFIDPREEANIRERTIHFNDHFSQNIEPQVTSYVESQFQQLRAVTRQRYVSTGDSGPFRGHNVLYTAGYSFQDHLHGHYYEKLIVGDDLSPDYRQQLTNCAAAVAATRQILWTNLSLECQLRWLKPIERAINTVRARFAPQSFMNLIENLQALALAAEGRTSSTGS